MNRIKYRISLDMLEVTSQTTIKAKKGDTACSIHVTLMENGKIYHIVDGCHAVFSGKKPDGNYLFNGETCRIEDNTIIYDFTKQTTPVEGIVECELILYKGEDKLTSPRFNLKVDSTVYNGEEIISTPEADALKELTDRAEDIVNQFDEGVIVGKEYLDNAIADLEDKIENQEPSIDLSIAANALKGSASGSVVSIKDVSPLEHDLKVKVTNIDSFATLISGADAILYDVVDASEDGYYITFDGDYISLNADSITVKNNWESFYIGESHKKGFSADFGGFNGAFINAVLKNDTRYYALRLTNNEGGKVSCAIDKNKVYLSLNDSDLNVYEVEEGTEFYYITCDGFDFSTNKIAVYDCSVNVNATDVKVKVFGKNLIDWKDASLWKGGWHHSTKEYRGYLLPTKAGITYCISFDVNDKTDIPQNFYLTTYDAEGNKVGSSITFITDKINYLNRTFKAEKGYSYYIFPASKKESSTEANFQNWLNKFKYIQCEIGSTATEYEPYTEYGDYTVNADGSVDGVRSIYPSMTLMPDTEGVTLDVEYNRDINKAFAELQTALISMGGNL